MSISITKKIVGSLVGIGAAVPVSWGVYKLSTGSALFDSSEEPSPSLTKTSTLKKFKGLSKGDYAKGTFAAKQVEKDNGKYFLGTGKENQAVWDEVFGILKGKSQQNIEEVFGITSGFTDSKDKKSLNGKCEDLYKKTEAEGEKEVNWSWICSPGNMSEED